MNTKNLLGKTRDTERPYAVYEADGWEWRVLKVYQAPHKELENPRARWLVAVKSPYTHGSWDIGDSYAREIRRDAVLTQADAVWHDHWAQVDIVSL